MGMVTMGVCLILLCLLLCCCACGWYLLCVSVARKKAEDTEKPALVSVASEHTEVKLDIPDNEERWSLIALDKLAKVSGSFNLGPRQGASLASLASSPTWTKQAAS